MCYLDGPYSAPGWGLTAPGPGVTLAEGGRSRTDVIASWVTSDRREGRSRTVQEAEKPGCDLGMV